MKYHLYTQNPVALLSRDHLSPRGTKLDSSRNPRFNRKLYALFKFGFIRVLDLGCAGGGFVRECLDDGCEAVGLEGSNVSQQLRRAEWRHIPENLFTCDITKSFTITYGAGPELPAVFDVVTAWEVFEHIHEHDLRPTFANIERHTMPSSLLIASISPEDDVENGVNWHVTVKSKEWWIEKISCFGFHHMPSLEHYFNRQFVRGGNGKHGNRSFNLVLARRPDLTPDIPKEPFHTRLYDLWNGCMLQRLIVGNY